MKRHLQWPFRSFIRIEREESDSWKISRAYVADYRTQIEEITKCLEDKSDKFISLQSRLNLEKSRAEIYFKKNGLTFIQIHVNGEMGTPYEIVITTVSPLAPETIQMIHGILGSKLLISFVALL